MKLLITEEQYKRIQSKLTYESMLDDLVFKLSLLNEDDGKTEPDMEWDFTKTKEEIDLSKMWVKTVTKIEFPTTDKLLLGSN